MGWTTDDAKDLMDMLAGAKLMRDGAKTVKEAVCRIRDRHRMDATAPFWVREARVEDDARHVAQEADEIERDGAVIRRMFGGELA